jgi:tRNA(His) guanylyltransferase
MPDNLGDRMKMYYEDRNRLQLIRRTPVIMRLDGRAFHTLTRKAVKPFDYSFIAAMQKTAIDVFEIVQGAKVAYVQSDEISILVTDFDTLTTDAWFDYNVQKMCSIAAAKAAVRFSKMINSEVEFDCRVFNIPEDEVVNYFRWRYKDWVRNSLQMLARAHFSHKELNKKGHTEMHDMLHSKGINWADLMPVCKNGTTITRKSTNELYDWMDKGAIDYVKNLMHPESEDQ